MNEVYVQEYTDLLERVLSVAYKRNYYLPALERQISYSQFFRQIERSDNGQPPFIVDNDLVKEIYPEINVSLADTPVYEQCLWAAEAYIRIQESSKLSYEAIFLYIPIKKMYEYFDLYHEMDFIHIINEFYKLFKLNSVIGLLIKKCSISMKTVSKQIGIPYDSLYSYKSRRRDIKKMEAKSAYDLATLLRVRIETLLEITL